MLHFSSSAQLIHSRWLPYLITVTMGILLGTFFGDQSVYAEPEVKRPNEMEFDARVIKGQRAEGAVYLFQRAARPLPPLLSYKRDYLGAIIAPVFGSDTELGQRVNTGAEKKLKIGDQTSPNGDESPSKVTSDQQKKTSSSSIRSQRGKTSKTKPAQKPWRARSKK